MLRILIAAALLLLAPPLIAAEMVMRAGANELRLYDSACVHAGTLAQLQPQWREKFKKAMAKVNGQTYYACWIVMEDGVNVFVIFEDGDQGAWPMTSFKDTSV